MDIIKFSINKPVNVLVGVIMVVIFGLIGLSRLPYQLSPTVIEPDITVTTNWRGATPYEIEREIIEPQETTLKGITGLKEMESNSRNSQGTITLRFEIGTEVDTALLRVSNQVNEVRSYPEGADKPIIRATGAATSPVIWITMKTLEGNERHIDTYTTFFEDEIRQHIERVEGVADLFVGGGTPEEMHIIIKPEKLASYGLTVRDIISTLASENVNISAGNLGVGRRDYRIRTTGEFKSEQDIGDVVLRSTGQRRILLKDIADIRRGYAKKRSSVIHNFKPSMAIGVKPEPGVNILDLTERVEDAINWLNESKMKDEGLYFHWVYDQRWYINGAIKLIQNNILIGGLLAICVLLIFLRSIRSTLVVAMSIPISIIGTFLFMYMMGRNLNVVSLAGIAFAVGMLVDNAIVVIENIDRHRKMGKSPFAASYEGTQEVWGAVLASTLTTIAVFLPVVFIVEEAGQLFRDIAIAVVAAVSLSLVVAVTVIPMLTKKMFSYGDIRKDNDKSKDISEPGRLVQLGMRLREMLSSIVSLAIGSWRSRLVTIISLSVLAVLTVIFLTPKMEYLPQGNRNFILNILVPPPGLSAEERLEIGESFFEMARPYLENDEYEGKPGILNMFFVGRDSIMLAGAMAKDWSRARELKPVFNKMISSVPGMAGVSIQPGIFQSSFGKGRSIDLDIKGNDINSIVQAAGLLYMTLKKEQPMTQIRPVPSIELLYPEVKIIPNRDRLKANSMTTAQLGEALDVLLDGRDIGDFKEDGKKKIDLILKTETGRIATPEDLFNSQISTPGGRVISISTLADIERTYGITQIRHLERTRAITLQVTPPESVPLQEAMENIENNILKPFKEKGMLKGVDVEIGGAADKLKETRKALQWNFVLAAVIAYLLMAALFGNFIYPLIIMFTVPLAGAGGFIGLRLLDALTARPMPMDILTMLGFVILIGVVVNNAILIVHQSLNNVRLHRMPHKEAVLEATRTRLRPIYMSALTSIFGMLPLVIFPGAGSELYRGLGSVILGGLAVSTIFTVFIIPSLLMFAIRMEKDVSADLKESTNEN
jgi:HAE1 family hydrophobic/amphiphilic exporter-1